MASDLGYKAAEQASDWAFRQRTPKQRMDWLEDIWELQKIGRMRRKAKQNHHQATTANDDSK